MAKSESNSKDNTLSIIALVALVAVVGMVVAFAVSSKGSTQTATPVYVTAAPASSENSAGMMRGLCDNEEGYENCKTTINEGNEPTADGLRSCWNYWC